MAREEKECAASGEEWFVTEYMFPNCPEGSRPAAAPLVPLQHSSGALRIRPLLPGPPARRVECAPSKGLKVAGSREKRKKLQ